MPKAIMNDLNHSARELKENYGIELLLLVFVGFFFLNNRPSVTVFRIICKI